VHERHRPKTTLIAVLAARPTKVLPNGKSLPQSRGFIVETAGRASSACALALHGLAASPTA